VHYLCTSAGVKDIRAIMSEMSMVVEDMADRVLVDLTGDDLGQCLQVFDVMSWTKKDQTALLQKRINTLAKALHVDARVRDAFQGAAKLLLKVVCAAQANKLKISNRQAWTWILCLEWRARYFPPHCNTRFLPDLEKMICFYLALKVNTTTLERNLGQLCNQLHAHAGPTAQDGRLLSAVLHVALDGPGTAKELFEVRKAECAGSEVGFTPTGFSLACGKLWLAMYGRRFRYKYAKEPTSCPSRPSRKRKAHACRGTFEWVKKKRKEAASHLCKVAQEQASQAAVDSFVPNLELPLPHSNASGSKQALSGTRWQSSASASSEEKKPKKTASELFRDHTDRKRASALHTVYCH